MRSGKTEKSQYRHCGSQHCEILSKAEGRHWWQIFSLKDPLQTSLSHDVLNPDHLEIVSKFEQHTEFPLMICCISVDTVNTNISAL